MQEELLLQKVRDIVSNIFIDNKIELVDITYMREGGRRVLRILADTESGITVDECTRINEVIGEALDREDIMDANYILEVSSPGLDRPLKTRKDFLRIEGERIHVHTFAPIDGKKEFAGTLESVDEDGIVVGDDSAKLTKIPFVKISKATLDYKNIL